MGATTFSRLTLSRTIFSKNDVMQNIVGCSNVCVSLCSILTAVQSVILLNVVLLIVIWLNVRLPHYIMLKFIVLKFICCADCLSVECFSC